MQVPADSVDVSDGSSLILTPTLTGASVTGFPSSLEFSSTSGSSQGFSFIGGWRATKHYVQEPTHTLNPSLPFKACVSFHRLRMVFSSTGPSVGNGTFS